jgi:basic membrane protein A
MKCKNSIAVIGAILLIAAAFFVSCENKKDASGTQDKEEKVLNVGLVYSGGGKGDKGINDLMYYAMERICQKNGWNSSDLENESASNVEPSNRQFCEQGKDVIINFGFGCIDVVNRLAREYPEITFITIDAVTDSLPNVRNITFKEHEGSFLVGAIAGLMTKTNVVGFVGGMENDMIKGFNAGFAQGVKAANPSCQVLSAYCGATVQAFADPIKGKEIALSHYDMGADIVYHAAGGSGQGVFEAAIARNRWAIGVDANQQSEAPDNIITSMLKRVDTAIELSLTEIAENRFEAGLTVYGLKENGVGYVNDETNAGKIPADVVSKVEELKQKVLAGEITIATTL